MIKNKHLTTALVAFLCLFSIVPIININVFLACAICLLYSILVIGLGKGLLAKVPLFLMWGFNLFFLTIFLAIANSKMSNYNLILISLTIMGVAIISNYRSVRLDMIITTIAIFSGISICIWLIRILIPELKNGAGLDGTNGISVSAAILFYYSVWVIDRSQRRLRIILILVAILGIIAASERSNFILIPLPALVIYFYFNDKKKLIKFFEIGLCIGIALILFFGLRSYLVNVPAFARLYTTYDMFMAGDTVSSGRDRMNDIAIRLWQKKPLLGNGWFYFYYNNKNILENGQYVHVHNYILELLCDCGVIGTIIALFPFAFAIIKNVAMLNNIGCNGVLKFTLSMQFFFLTDSLFHVSLYSPKIIAMYFLIIIIMSVCIKQNNDNVFLFRNKLYFKTVYPIAEKLNKN